MKLSEHFNKSEFICKCGCGYFKENKELIRVLEDVRNYFNEPVQINSGCRCIEHNASVGGSKNSKHIDGMAADIRVEHIHPNMVADYLENIYYGTYGIGRYRGRTHIDVRKNKARWDNR